MQKIYLDCDGVILNTENSLFEKYKNMQQNDISINKSDYLRTFDWASWLYYCGDINNAINILLNYDPTNIEILTKVHSIEEASAKINYFRYKNIKNNIIIVPSNINKNYVVGANGNILVDNSLINLSSWSFANGIPVYFGEESILYPSITSLDEILDSTKRKKVLKL